MPATDDAQATMDDSIGAGVQVEDRQHDQEPSWGNSRDAVTPKMERRKFLGIIGNPPELNMCGYTMSPTRTAPNRDSHEDKTFDAGNKKVSNEKAGSSTEISMLVEKP